MGLPFKRDDAEESAPMRHLRSSSKSMLAGGFWRKLEIPVLALLGWLASVAVALPPMALLTLLACWTNTEAMTQAFSKGDVYEGLTMHHWVAAISAIVFLIGLVVIGIMQHFQRRWGASAQLPSVTIGIVGCMLLLTLTLVGWLLFPYGAALSVIDLSEIKVPAFNESFIALISALAIPVFSQLATRSSKASRWKLLFNAIAVVLLPTIFIWMTMILIAKYGIFIDNASTFSTASATKWLVGSLLAFAFVVLVLSVNAVSLHPFYRDRIARTFHLTQPG